MPRYRVARNETFLTGAPIVLAEDHASAAEAYVSEHEMEEGEYVVQEIGELVRVNVERSEDLTSEVLGTHDPDAPVEVGSGE
jgi:hypothetical protein